MALRACGRACFDERVRCCFVLLLGRHAAVLSHLRVAPGNNARVVETCGCVRACARAMMLAGDMDKLMEDFAAISLEDIDTDYVDQSAPLQCVAAKCARRRCSCCETSTLTATILLYLFSTSLAPEHQQGTDSEQ